MSSNVRTIVSAGYVPLDITLYNAQAWHAAGGTAGNVAAILGFLGWKSTVVTPLGGDVAGDVIRADLAASGVEVCPATPTQGLATPRILHRISAKSHSYAYRCSECDQKLPSSRPLTKEVAEYSLNSLAVPDVFFFDRLNTGTIRMAEYFGSQGSLIVFEPSRPAREDLTMRAVAAADVVKLAAQRAEAIHVSEGRAGQTWIVTDGARGAQYRVGVGGWRSSPAFSYPLVDAAGAGDWTTAGFLHALGAQRRTIDAVRDALRSGQALAAVSCGFPGARGLARQGSARSVLAIASAVKRRNAILDADARRVSPRLKAPPPNTCPLCLLPVQGVVRPDSRAE